MSPLWSDWWIGEQSGLVHSGCGGPGPDESVGDSRASRADAMGGARRVLSRLCWWRAVVCLVSSCCSMGAMVSRQPGRARPIISWSSRLCEGRVAASFSEQARTVVWAVESASQGKTRMQDRNAWAIVSSVSARKSQACGRAPARLTFNAVLVYFSHNGLST
jgi:hypothetical protein